MITGGQIRAGRAFAKLSAAELAKCARLARMTVVRAESADGPPPITEANLHAIQIALEAAGVTFGPDGSVGFHPKHS
jgi:hypothetical protein